jgi:D-serine dehydratase
LIEDIQAYQPLVWYNPNTRPYEEARTDIPLTVEDIDEARRRMHRWEPVLAQLFPESFPGRIESPLVELLHLPRILLERYQLNRRDDRPASSPLPRILLKLDSHLAVSGSIKARGGFHEVLALTERITGIETADRIAVLDTTTGIVPEGYSIAVGSTGNLGLSIGILGAALGYNVTVHMSADARRWKKDLLRSRGVTVIEHDGDFGTAVAAGRAAAAEDPRCHFVDDERSRELFLGYAAAAKPLRLQLRDHGVRIDEDHPLYVYLPCGVGGGPGGVTFGLKEEFGDHVRCFFVEPTHAPAMLAGMVTGLHDRISVQDLGLDNRTVADGLAVGRPSGLVGPAMQRIISGIMTLSDEEMLAMVALLAEHEGYRLEPSAVAGLPGPFRIAADRGTPLHHGTHLVWATGGNMVPREEMEQWIHAGEAILRGETAG